MDTEPAGEPVRTTPAEAAVVPAGVEVRIGLATLLGLHERAGELPGWGPALPAVARALVLAQQRGARWRYAVTDADGQLIFGGTVSRRPTFPTGPPSVCDGGIVELHVSAGLLARLAADPAAHGPWASVISDIAAQYVERSHRLARLNAHPNDRFARARLITYLHLRDRTCLGVGCRRAATHTQIDHTRDHATGGPTIDSNLGCLCARHHGHKTKGWWRLAQPNPGHFIWTSPLGRTYRTRGEPFDPPSTGPHARPPEPDPGIILDDTGPTLPMPPQPSPVQHEPEGAPPF